MENRWYYTPAEISTRLGWDAQYIRDVAHANPSNLPFPVLVHGNRTQIPKAQFEAWFARCTQTVQADCGSTQ